MPSAKPSAAPFSIRHAAAEDAEAILACLHIAFEAYRSFYSKEGFADTTLTLETLRLRLRHMDLFVAVNASGEIVGTIACQLQSAHIGHIRGMAVLPEWQGGGVANSLLLAAEEQVRAAGAKRVTLGTTQPLKRAIRFYERNGYRLLPETGDHFGMPLLKYMKEL